MQRSFDALCKSYSAGMAHGCKPGKRDAAAAAVVPMKHEPPAPPGPSPFSPLPSAQPKEPLQPASHLADEGSDVEATASQSMLLSSPLRLLMSGIFRGSVWG